MQLDKRNRVNLSEGILLFARQLRRSGAQTSPNQAALVLQALARVEFTNKRDVYHALRAVLIHRKEDYPIFDRVFRAFWGTGLKIEKPGPTEQPKANNLLRNYNDFKANPDKHGAEMVLATATSQYSAVELLRFKDFSELTPEDEDTIKRLIKRGTWLHGLRRTHRWQAGDGARYDMRATLRRNLCFGTEIVSWQRQQRKSRPRPIVILADISGSMKSYTRILLHFFYGLSNNPAQFVETFIFGTRLTRVTRELNSRPPSQALSRVSRKIKDWGGGTRVGASIKKFNYAWARRVLRSNAVVLLVSDGLDRGDPALLEKEMARLQRSCYRLVWLNPLLGSPDYRPQARGMRAALPFVDDFLPVHNLASLEQLAQHLASLNQSRNHRTRNLGFADARHPA